MNLDSSMIWIVIAVVALLAFYFYNRSRPAPRGTYDDKHMRSSGSIGGGNRAYDDPEQRSSGSIGGGQRGYDAPAQESHGSIGGSTTSQRPPNQVHSDRMSERKLDDDLERNSRGIDRDSPLDRLPDERAHPVKEATHNQDERHQDDERFKSKGTIGG